MAELPDYKWPKEEAAILKAMWDGKADAHMQRRVITHIVEILCAINRVGFDPDNTHLSAVNAGRKWVGRQIQNAVTIPLDRLCEDDNGSPGERRGGIRTATERYNEHAISSAVEQLRTSSGTKRK